MNSCLNLGAQNLCLHEARDDRSTLFTKLLYFGLDQSSVDKAWFTLANQALKHKVYCILLYRVFSLFENIDSSSQEGSSWVFSLPGFQHVVFGLDVVSYLVYVVREGHTHAPV